MKHRYQRCYTIGAQSLLEAEKQLSEYLRGTKQSTCTQHNFQKNVYSQSK